jgi:hypothetical protein
MIAGHFRRPFRTEFLSIPRPDDREVRKGITITPGRVEQLESSVGAVYL